MEGASQVGPDLDFAEGHHVSQLGDGVLCALLLGQDGHALRDAVHRLLRYLGPLPALDQGVRIQSSAQGLVLLKAQGHFLQHLPVRAPDEDAHLVQPRQVLGHLLETADEEVADGDVGPGGAAQHLFEPCEERGVGLGVEDVAWGHNLLLDIQRVDC